MEMARFSIQEEWPDDAEMRWLIAIANLDIRDPRQPGFPILNRQGPATTTPHYIKHISTANRARPIVPHNRLRDIRARAAAPFVVGEGELRFCRGGDG